VPLAEIILDDIKEALNDTDAVFLGDAELLINGVDDINLCQARDGSPLLLSILKP
jgi:hypothetical protein